ncbi:ADAMTS-like protein 1 isoform X1 [Centruroides sculpturatus]|uniref:ADAMTS-like protein 1 isoform X1 n=1 Tax=Centruroides sculpturatus TaxID=218467 RepID=UPI000C6EE50D|nr:ADAMTS-like protein 1 isoform X1 [Centruroides sculpturatus]
MQPCKKGDDFRATQCSAYNNIPYRKKLYNWKPYYDSEKPCSLTCQAESYNFVITLASKVIDGTRCRDGSLDMCVSGVCMSVGCDLQLGSTKRVDECGVCGGDGTSCRKPAYQWIEAQFSPCSVTCGGGYQMSRPVCLNKESGKEMDERLCDISKRPRPLIRECNSQKCPASWIIESWSVCSSSCGGGKQTRQVYCAQGGPNGTRIKISNHHCPHHKPITQRSCNVHTCPRWFNGPWSGCSVSCGLGHQTRAVFCHDARGYRTEGCDKTSMPPTKQSCATGIACLNEGDNDDDDEDDNDSEIAEGSQEDAPPQLSDSQPRSQKIVASPRISIEPNYVAGDWSPCSATCDKGVRTRTVNCKIFLEFSKSIATLPDKECTGPRPPEIENCYARPCALDQNKQEENDIPRGQVGIEVTYSWRSAGFSPCSASCLGGTKESVIHCVRDHDQAIVDHYKCDIRKKPDSITLTCNDLACPPRWNISEFTPCSKQCGGGKQKRVVQCLQEVTRGAANIFIVPNSNCPQPEPPSEQLCNTLECPVRWKAGLWSKCSKSCGEGLKTRKIRCQRELAFGQVIELPPSSCPKKKPKTIKTCNTKPCPGKKIPKPAIYTSQQTYEQKQPQNRVTLKVGGKALIFGGTNVKIRCPSRKINKTLIMWYKDNEKLQSSKKFKISRKGALRIRKITMQDSGIYSCIAGMSKADIKIIVKPYSKTSDEDKTVERPVLSVAIPDMPPDRTIEENDKSHEFHRSNKELEDSNKSHFVNQGRSTSVRDFEQTKEEFTTSPNTQKYWPKKPKTTKPKNLPPNDSLHNLPQDTNILMSSETSDPKIHDTWENNHGGDVISDQQSEEINRDRSHENYETTEEMDIQSTVTSGAASNQPFQSFHHMLSGFRVVDTNSDELDDPSMLETKHVVLGKGSPESLEFDWMVTPWSKCSESCGSTGFQMRASQCLVRFNNVTKSVDSRLCVDRGLQPPITMQKCGMQECPHWETGPWSECSESSCFTWNLAHQKREVTCRLANGTDVDDQNCDDKTRPRRRRNCNNDQCRGSWIVGEWSECTATCGNQGFQTRILQCVWYGTRRPAGNACRAQPRPTVLRFCKRPQCPPSERRVHKPFQVL